MKGKIFLALFALPFFGIGVWMLCSSGNMVWQGYQARDWVAVPATLSAAGYETHSGEDSVTYEVYASYQYVIDGRTHHNDRVQLSPGADNIGDFHQALGNRLSGALRRGETVTAFVDPSSPGQSVLDRQFRWGLFGFKLIFVLLFGGVGLGLLIAAFRAARSVDTSLPEFRDAPWLANPEWQSADIRSNSKHAMWGAWAFAAFWNLVSAPLPFVIVDEISNKQNYLVLVALLFPLIGIGLAVWAIRRTREWRRFGATPVRLDPFPGSIGGQVGGSIDTRIPFDSRQRYRVTLSAIYRYVSGSGDSRSVQENAKWQDEIVAHAESTGRGTRISFRFDVPEDLPEADAQPTGDDYYLWRLGVSADLPHTDLDRQFEIPVYATATASRAISDREAGAASHVQDEVFGEAVRQRIRIDAGHGGKQLVFPMGQALLSNSAAILIGGSFAAAGWYIAVLEGERLFGGVFGGTGALILLAASYMLGKSLHVRRHGDTVTSIRRWCGIPLGRKYFRISQFARFAAGSNMQTRSGNQHIRHYKLSAVDRAGNSVLVGEGFRGEAELRAAKQLLSRELGLRESSPSPERDYTTRFQLNKEMFLAGSAGEN